MESKRTPSFSLAFGTFMLFVGILAIGMLALKLDVHGLLIIGLVIVCFATRRLGYSFDEMIQMMVNGLSRSMSALFIFIMIGAVIGSWMEAGTVPALIYYGLKLLSPKIFLPAGLIICSIMSVACGTSWGTLGTVGVALIGIGESLGMPLPLVAGMIVSGACFGDKMSPISETTNLAPISAEADLYDHIRAMMYTTIPTFIICLVAYTLLGFKYGGSSMDLSQVKIIQDTLTANFNISIIVLLPVVVTLGLSLMKYPALIAMTAGVFTGGLVAVIFQGSTLANILNVVNYGFKIDTGILLVDKLLNRGGIQGMMWTLSMSLIIIGLGGILDEAGYLPVMVEKMTKVIKKPASLVTAAIATTFGNCMATGDSYMPIILTGKLYGRAFDKAGIARSMLSRCSEEGGTLAVPIIPWSVTAGFFSGTLGVSCADYAPYALLNWINPLLSIVLAYLGIFIIYNKTKNKRSEKAGDVKDNFVSDNA